MTSSPKATTLLGEFSEGEPPLNDLDWSIPYENTSHPEVLGDAGLTCELKRFDSLINAQGDRVVLPTGSTRNINWNCNRSLNSALMLTKVWDKEQCLEYTELEIRSPHMKAALQSVVPSYKDFPIKLKHIIIRNQPACLFHYQHGLQKYGSTVQDPEAAKHILFLLQYMWRELRAELLIYYSSIDDSGKATSLDYHTLWMAFKPGDLIFVPRHTAKGFHTEEVMQLESIDRCRCQNKFCPWDYWTVTGTQISYDGQKAGHGRVIFYIKKFEGYRPLKDLTGYPLRYDPNERDIRARLVKRGRRFCDLQGTHYRQYQGVAQLINDHKQLIRTDDVNTELREVFVKGRIIIDVASFEEARPIFGEYLDSRKKSFDPNEATQPEMSDDEYLICRSVIQGYSLNEKQWGHFNIDSIEDVQLNSSAFDSLILDEEKKKQIISLVQAHEGKEWLFDDVIHGKGKGMIFLLHGEPGVGKTLTAESVADYCRKPLLRLDASYLGITPRSVEDSLTSICRFAEKWKAIALLDEADVFLEQRQRTNLPHNGLVSVLLRMLEYYEGILFLTTNRIGSFDKALKSRVHLAIHYPELGPSSRLRLWQMFLSHASIDSVTPLVEDGTLEELAQEELNGRQIKNLARTASALAFSDHSLIQRHHIFGALEPMKHFDRDFKSSVEEDKMRKIRQAQVVMAPLLKRRRFENEGTSQ